MPASLIDGKFVAAEIKRNIKRSLQNHTAKGYPPPGLAVILIGENPASTIYVNNKRKMCEEVGIRSYAYDLPVATEEKTLLSLIDQLNTSNHISGILVQLPLPQHINTRTIIEHILPEKDVDGFHPYNLGRLTQGAPLLRPCTPYGIIQLLRHYQIDLVGKNAVIVGASNIVGRPMALELLLAKATVTICHSKTRELEKHIRSAEIIITAAGTYDVVKTTWLNNNHIVVDVGIHRHSDGTIHGDIDFQKASHIVKWITPVPGGVGPMTVCTLLQNTLWTAGIQ